jgi:hypothetical protein
LVWIKSIQFGPNNSSEEFYTTSKSKWENENDFSQIFFIIVLGVGYTVAFTKVLTIYQICHTWIHTLHHSPTSPPFLEWFQQVSFFHLQTCAHSIFTIFNLLHHFPTFFHLPLLPTPLSQAGPVPASCSLILYKKKRRRKWKFCLFKVDT